MLQGIYNCLRQYSSVLIKIPHNMGFILIDLNSHYAFKNILYKPYGTLEGS